MFHVRGRGGIFCPAAAAAATAALACFVCCMICVISSSCCRVRPSFPVPALLLAGDKLGEGVLVLPAPESTLAAVVRVVTRCWWPELAALLLELLLLFADEVRLL